MEDYNNYSKKEKRQYLKNNGWKTLWSEDNWLKEGVIYNDPDRSGCSTDIAFASCVNINNDTKRILNAKSDDPTLENQVLLLKQRYAFSTTPESKAILALVKYYESMN